MRLDKYLQVTGLIKRRTLANQACKLGLVKINGVVAKATREVAIDDVIDIELAQRDLSVKVIQLISGNSLKKSDRHEYFTLLKDQAKESAEGFWLEDSDV